MTATTVPGDPGGIRSAAGVLGETAEDAAAVIDRLQSLEGSSGDSMWRGPAADAFREKLGELPCKLVKLRDSYGVASDALYRFANDVDQLQDEASSAEQTEAWAEEEVAFREREMGDAEVSYPEADLSAYDQAVAQARQKVSQAKAEVAQVKESYRGAEDRCIASLGDASDAGIENTFFGSVREALGAIEDIAAIVGTVLLVVALVALVVAAVFFSGGVVAGILAGIASVAFTLSAVAGVVAGVALLGRWALGDDVSLSEVAFAALSIVTLGALSKGKALAMLLGKAGKALKVGTALTKVGTALINKLPPGLRGKAWKVVEVFKNKDVRDATVEEFLDKVWDKVVGPLGPVIGLPGILERIYGDPSDRPGGAACPEPGDPGDSESRTPERGDRPEPEGPRAPAPDQGGPREPIPEPSAPAPASPSSPSAPPPSAGGGGGAGPAPSAGGGGGGGAPAPAGPGPGSDHLTPLPGGGPVPSPGGPAPAVPAPGPDPAVPGGGCDPAVPAPGAGPTPQPVPGDGPLPGDCVEGEPVGGQPGDGGPVGGQPGGGRPEATIVLPDGTVVTIDTPGGPGPSDGGGSTSERIDTGSEPVPAPAAPLQPAAPADSVEPVEPQLISASPAPTGDLASARSDAGLGVDPQPLDRLDEPRGPADREPVASAGRSGGGAAPGPAPAPAPPPGPGTLTTEGGPDQSLARLASAKPKVPLSSPLLLGGLAAGGLIGGGAAYVITDARHKFRKEEDEEPLPQPVGLRF